MSSNSNSKKNNKNLKALFSVICLSVIALGAIVYFTTTGSSKNDTVNEPTTVMDTTAVQRSVTVEDTTAETTVPTTEVQTEATTESTSMPLTDTNTPYKSFYQYPAGEAVLFGYSEELVFNKTMKDYRSHPAVDFKAEEGTEVLAVNDGIVLNVYNDARYGIVIEIDHGGQLIAKYCGLDSASVSAGDNVAIGGVIGTLGKVPCEATEEAHLHFETKLEGKSVNPLDVMGKTE